MEQSVRVNRARILMIDGESAALAEAGDALSPRYEFLAVPSADNLSDVPEDFTPDLILLDSGLPGSAPLSLLKPYPRLNGIPVILLLANDQEEEAFPGAADYITRPLSPSRLRRMVETRLTILNQRARLDEQQTQIRQFHGNLQSMVRKTTNEIYELQNAILSTVAELVEFRDNVTGGHITRTQRYLSLLVTKLISRGIYMDAISSWDLNFLLPSAQLHDVGKIAISDTILNKPARLDPEEFEIMKRHTTFGVLAIEKIEGRTTKHEFLKYAKVFAGTHHEKWDGSGYPQGLKGQDIPLQGRLMAIADVYDALIAIRPYKTPLPIETAERIICEGSGTHFDPQLVEVFNLVAPEFAKVAGQFIDTAH